MEQEENIVTEKTEETNYFATKERVVEEKKEAVKVVLSETTTTNCIATLYEKTVIAEKGKGAVFSEIEIKVIKPAMVIERSFAETYNKDNSIGRYYVINENETKKLNLK